MNTMDSAPKDRPILLKLKSKDPTPLTYWVEGAHHGKTNDFEPYLFTPAPLYHYEIVGWSELPK